MVFCLRASSEIKYKIMQLLRQLKTQPCQKRARQAKESEEEWDADSLYRRSHKGGVVPSHLSRELFEGERRLEKHREEHHNHRNHERPEQNPVHFGEDICPCNRHHKQHRQHGVVPETMDVAVGESKQANICISAGSPVRFIA
jgi:hypothetical protein